jgi:shikimate dehydrogenase
MNRHPSRDDRARLLLGLIGSGIQASLTPAMHEREAAEHGVLCLYQRIDLDLLGLGPDALPDLLSAAEKMGFAGLNITHPCKQSVLALLTDLSDDACALGAVNTVVLRNGHRSGHNTDWLAFGENFRRGLPGAPIDRIVQLGAGGAGAATAYAMLKMGTGHITIFDLEPARGVALAARCAALFGAERVSAGTDLEAGLACADGLIHATPTGMYGHPGIALAPALLRSDLWVAEVVYFPLETELLRAARAAGCSTLDGSGMAVHQAVEAFRLFSGLQPDPERMHRRFIDMVESR